MWLDRAGGPLIGAMAAGLLAAVLVLAGTLALSRPGAAGPDLIPWSGGIGALTARAPADHVGSAACAACHGAQAQAWASSHHARAMSRATPDTVLGTFDGARIGHAGMSARFFREGERFLVEIEGRDGARATFEVSDTFGVYPLQQYLVTYPDGRRQVLPFAYDTRPAAEQGQRWFPLTPSQTPPPGDPRHWMREQQNWNFMCAECHSTAVRKNYHPAADTFDTMFSEISVGCEACHGAGRGHVDWARGSRDASVPRKGFAAVAASRPPIDFTPDPATGRPRPAAARPTGDEVETCARCHARRGAFSQDWRPGHPLADTHWPVLLTQGLFEADGQMLDEVFNDQAFKQSLMYARGVVCSDCHDPHAATLKAPGAQVCTQCHLPDRFARTEHTGHAPGPGAPDCISCHMPTRTYMGVDIRHDHSFRIPRPDLSARLGTPNACTACHGDRDASWAAEAIARWHGPDRKGFQTWAEPFHQARDGAAEARAALIRLATAPDAPAVVRATAVSELRGFPSRASADAIREALADPDPLVRAEAVRGQAGLPPDQRWQRVEPALSDPVALVRLAAADILADLRPDLLPATDRARLEAAFAAYEAAQGLNLDRPEARANLANFLLRRGDASGAEAHLRAGLKLAPDATALAVNLADLYRMLGREQEGEAALRAAIAAAPAAAEAHHALGLALIRQRRHGEAMAELEQAVRQAPGRARYAYVRVVALQSLGRLEEAARALDSALRTSPNDADLLALALNGALRAGDAAEARAFADRLAALRPDDSNLTRLRRSLQGR